MNQKRIEPYQVYTTPEAAEMLGVSEMLIINSCKKGDLKAVAVGRGWKKVAKVSLFVVIEEVRPGHYNPEDPFRVLFSPEGLYSILLPPAVPSLTTI